MKISFIISPNEEQSLEILMKKGNVRTKQDLLNNALAFLEWGCRQREKNREIGSRGEDGIFREVTMPVLDSFAASSDAEVIDPPVRRGRHAV